ncbi:MAG: hypothetical protein D6726_03165 [Nitrospirae bacterium]|nr:MAG: hypothetical protein D6726_03165 [Nitrospirota bacterium]
MEYTTNCDRCGKEIKVVKEVQDDKTFYMIHGLFCINIPAFFCEKECFESTISTIKQFDYTEKDDDGKPIIDVDVMINESLLLDRMYDIVYDAENPLYPTLVLQRLLAVDPGNLKFLYGLGSLYLGLLMAENTPEEVKEKIASRLSEVESDMKSQSEEVYKNFLRVKQHYGFTVTDQ